MQNPKSALALTTNSDGTSVSHLSRLLSDVRPEPKARIRRPIVAKHPWRTSDGITHPVTVRRAS